jgi:hypothetical protein
MFIMQRIGQRELMLDDDHVEVWTYNKMHASFKVQVEWGIGGLKRKWRHLMKTFYSTKLKYAHLFRAATLLINFLHKRRMDLTYDVVGDQIANWATRGWAKDF